MRRLPGMETVLRIRFDWPNHSTLLDGCHQFDIEGRWPSWCAHYGSGGKTSTCKYVFREWASKFLFVIKIGIWRPNRPRVHEFIQEMHKRVLSSASRIHSATSLRDAIINYVPQNTTSSPLGKPHLHMMRRCSLPTCFQRIKSSTWFSNLRLWTSTRRRRVRMSRPSNSRNGNYPILKTQSADGSDTNETRTSGMRKWDHSFLYHKCKHSWSFRYRVFLENHDHSRVVSRFGNDSEKWRNKSAKLLAILQISQSGTQFIFQGQELGLKNFPGNWGIEEYKDVASQNYWNK